MRSVAILLEMVPKALSPSGHSGSQVWGSGCLTPTRKTAASYLQVTLTLLKRSTVEGSGGSAEGDAFWAVIQLSEKGVCFTLVANKCSDVMRCYEPYLPQTAFLHQKEPKSGV